MSPKNEKSGLSSNIEQDKFFIIDPDGDTIQGEIIRNNDWQDVSQNPSPDPDYHLYLKCHIVLGNGKYEKATFVEIFSMREGKEVTQCKFMIYKSDPSKLS